MKDLPIRHSVLSAAVWALRLPLFSAFAKTRDVDGGANGNWGHSTYRAGKIFPNAIDKMTFGFLGSGPELNGGPYSR